MRDQYPSNKCKYVHTRIYNIWKENYSIFCVCASKRTYDTTLCATLLLAINYCHFLLRMASDIAIRLPGFRLVFLIWNKCANFCISMVLNVRNLISLQSYIIRNTKYHSHVFTIKSINSSYNFYLEVLRGVI